MLSVCSILDKSVKGLTIVPELFVAVIPLVIRIHLGAAAKIAHGHPSPLAAGNDIQKPKCHEPQESPSVCRENGKTKSTLANLVLDPLSNGTLSFKLL